MRPFNELAAAIKSGGSIRMPDGEVITTEERLRELHPGSPSGASEAGDGDVAGGEAGESAETVSVPKAELQGMVEAFQKMEEENDSLRRQVAELETALAETTAAAAAEKEAAGESSSQPEGGEGGEQPTGGDSDALPEGFPGRAALEKAGVTTLAAVSGMDREALIAVNGIGAATAEEILAAREV